VDVNSDASLYTPVSVDGSLFRGQAGFPLRSAFRVDPYVFILALLPVLVLWRDSNPLFTPAGAIDPWVYFGYFHNLVSFKRDMFPGTYYGSRLSWILPGYVLNKLFSPLVANYVLHLSVYYTALLALFSLLKAAANRQAALLGATLFGFYPYLWSAVGWDYMDGAGIAWFLVTMVLLTRASAAPRRYGTLIAAGAVCAALVYSNLTWSLLCPTLLFYYLIRSRIERKASWIRALLEMAICFGGGIALVTGIFCLINHAIDGTYWFYAPSIGYALGTVGKKIPAKSPMAEWIGTARWLILPAATALFCLTIGIFRRKEFLTRQNLLGVLFVMQFFMAAGILLWMDTSGNPLLQYSYYASYLIPFTFLAIGSQVLRVPQLANVGSPMVVVFTLVVLGLSWVPADSYWVRLPTPLWPFGAALLVIGAGAVLVGRVGGLVTIIAVSAILYSYILVGGRPANTARGGFIRIARGVQEIEKVRDGRPVRFWFDASEKYGTEFHSLNSAYLWGYTRIGSAFPELPANVTLPSDTLLVVPSSRVDAVSEVVKSYKSDGKVLSLVSQQPMDAEGGRYSLSFLELITEPKAVQELTVSADEQGSGMLLSVAAEEVHAPLPRERWSSCNEKSCKGLMPAESDGVHVTTSASPWGYATMYSSLTIPQDGRYRFLLKYRILSGHMYFGVLKEDQSGWLGGVESSTATGRDRRMEYSLPLRRGDKIWLVTTNAEPFAKRPSAYVIEELRAFRYLDP